MTDLVYKRVMDDLKKKIESNYFNQNRLPDERTLSAKYHVSRSSVKQALSILAEQGIIFKKRGSGTFINPLYLKNKSIFSYEGSNLGITNNLKTEGYDPKIDLLEFKVVSPTAEIAEDLFLNPGDQVYEIKRLRSVDSTPIIIESGYIPVKVAPKMNERVVSGSIFNYLEEKLNKTGTKSYMSIEAQPSTTEDQRLLGLKPTEPVVIMGGIFFLDDGTLFEISNMRIHYKYFNYNTFVDLNN
ncbi:GntR family transcriptional regulator [Fructilactobacillus fructivorans]|uniref:GntR family transcriptional regulator n=1 Tax=Fructilactobacillus fructivorans TaxID=1614 RepID=UPI000704BCB1|nr:GntR family transcriptional regulator [Fructilactobacillus fructivorans]